MKRVFFLSFMSISLCSCLEKSHLIAVYPINMEYDYGDFRYAEIGDSVLIVDLYKYPDLKELNPRPQRYPHAIIKSVQRQGNSLFDIKISQIQYNNLLTKGTYARIENLELSSPNEDCANSVRLFEDSYHESDYKAIVKVAAPAADAYDVITNFKNRFKVPRGVRVERAIQGNEQITFILNSNEKVDFNWKELQSIKWFEQEELSGRILCLN